MALTRNVIAVDTQALGTVFVPRFSAFMIDAIKKRASELYPLPDPKPYEQPIDGALVPGDVLPAVQNPEYQKLLTEVMLQRNRYLQYTVMSAIEIPDGDSDDMIAHGEVVALYKTVLDSMRQAAAIPENDNVFALTLFYCVLKPDEYVEIVNAAIKEQPLSQEEIRNGLRIFRRDVHGHSTNGHHSEQGAPNIPEDREVQAQ